MRNLKRNNILIISLLLIVVLMSVGFAIISTTLNIAGSAKIKSQSWNIYFSNINVLNGSINATTNAHIANEANTLVEYNITLDKPGDYYEFTVDAVNRGTLDAKIDSIVLNGIEGHEDYLSYTATYLNGEAIKIGDALNSDTSETYKVRVEYKKNVTSLPQEDLNLNLTFLVTYTQGHEGTIVTDYYTLTGTVYDENGQPLNGGIVEVHSQVVSSEINENGQYTLKNVQVGQHEIVVKNTENEIVKEDNFTLIGGVSTETLNNMVVAGSSNGIGINLLLDNEIKLTTELPKHKVTIVSTNGESNDTLITRGSSKEITINPNTGYKYESMTCTKDLTYDTATNKIQISNIEENITCTINFIKACNLEVGASWPLNYNGSIQEFDVPCDGVYKLEVYGASGGKGVGAGGLGGYSIGYKLLNSEDNLYVGNGGAGTATSGNCSGMDIAGGYNGGGSGRNFSSAEGGGRCYSGASGGGATHIALNSNRGELKNYVNNQDEVLIIAGGGGGAANNAGGAGGGLTGGSSNIGVGGTQTPTYYGYGQGRSQANVACGGGAGYGGGTGATIFGGAGGGSGHIANVPEITFKEVIYTPNTIAGQRSGNGYSKITLMAIN